VILMELAGNTTRYLDASLPEEIPAPLLLNLVKKGEGVEGNLSFDKSKVNTKSELDKYTKDLTAMARANKLDPVLCREQEIRQILDVLSRRRKNNPIIVGEAGVGKTSLVDGLAQRIVAEQVPPELKGIRVLALDVTALQAGAGVKGEFEERVKKVLEGAVTDNCILFIDEAHIIVNNSNNLGNIIKPALARGDLRVIAATTHTEYKKHFEKEEGLSRRFQMVKVDEPSVEKAILMVRPIAKKISESHKVVISDEAVISAVRLSARYISSKQLPDKAIELLDTAAARVKIIRYTKPVAAENLRADMDHIAQEIEAMVRDRNHGFHINEDHFGELDRNKYGAEQLYEKISVEYDVQKQQVIEIEKLRASSTGIVADAEIVKDIRTHMEILENIPIESSYIYADVDVKLIASIVGEYTGIPVGSMLKDELQALMSLENSLKEKIKGQDDAVAIVAGEIQAARLHIKSTYTPQGVFLFVGPSGVGKTETAQAIANLVFGGERFVVTVNMSEYMEQHSVSRLIGSPPGYVGSGEGGVLTEGIRQRPYTVVLLDECEKAHPKVMELFYQVFDKGVLGDGDGRLVDCKNTVFIMTSNLASDLIVKNPDKSYSELTEMVIPVLNHHFKPALVGRMTIVPYRAISEQFMREIAVMKMNGLVKRIFESNRIRVEYDDLLMDFIVSQCTEIEFGARNIDHVIRKMIQPVISRSLMNMMAENKTAESMKLSYLDGQIVFTTSIQLS